MATRGSSTGSAGAMSSKKPDAQEHPAQTDGRAVMGDRSGTSWEMSGQWIGGAPGHRGDQALAASALASAPPMPYLRMKRSTRPSVSRIFWVPV